MINTVPAKVDCLRTVGLATAKLYDDAVKYAGMQKPFCGNFGIQRHWRHMRCARRCVCNCLSTHFFLFIAHVFLDVGWPPIDPIVQPNLMLLTNHISPAIIFAQCTEQLTIAFENTGIAV